MAIAGDHQDTPEDVRAHLARQRQPALLACAAHAGAAQSLSAA